MNAPLLPAPPSFWLCAGVWLVRMVLMLNAWWIVGLALVMRVIKPGPIRRGQWNGKVAGLGETGENYPFPSAALPAWLAWFDTPDEPGPFPAYEPGVMAIYNWGERARRGFGWWLAVWWNWSLRNVGHGLLYRFHAPVLVGYDNADLRRVRWGIGYGWKCYRDWRKQEAGAVAPPEIFYLVPSFFNNEK